MSRDDDSRDTTSAPVPGGTAARIETAAERRLLYLIGKEGKSNADFKEIDSLAALKPSLNSASRARRSLIGKTS